MYTPALLTKVSMRPNRSSAASAIWSAVAGSVMSPATVSRASASDGLVFPAVVHHPPAASAVPAHQARAHGPGASGDDGDPPTRLHVILREGFAGHRRCHRS